MKKSLIISLCIVIIEVLPFIVGLIELHYFQTDIFADRDFLYAYMAYFGTVLLGAISFWQNLNAQDANKRLTEENNNLQKIMAQSLIPTVRVENLEIVPVEKEFINKSHFPKKETFSLVRTYTKNESGEVLRKVMVNVDAGNLPLYEKQVRFQFENISNCFIRHIAIDHIEILGFQNDFNSIICKSSTSEDGFGGLYCPKDTLDIQVSFYTNDEVKKELWDDNSVGIGFILYLTNISMQDIPFNEYVKIEICNNGYQKVSYGSKLLEDIIKERDKK